MVEPREHVVGPRAAWRILRTRDLGLYLLGNAVSASGTWFQTLAAALLVYRLTRSEFLLGVLAFSQFGAVIVLAPWSGAAADRLDQRRLLLACQVAATALSAALAALAFRGLADEWVAIGFALAIGVTAAISAPVQMALVASLVAPRDLASAVALNSMAFNLARTVGPALAGVAVATVGIPATFAISAAAFLALVAALTAIRPRPQERSASPRLRESFSLLRREPRLAAYLAIVAVVGYAADPVNTLAPAFAEEFGRSDTLAGLVVGAFGAGAVSAALAVAGRAAGSRGRMSATLALLGGGIVLFSVSPWLPLGLAFLVGAGFGYLASNASATSRLQLGVEDAQRGRIMALWSVAFLGVRPVASLLDGAIAAAAGVRVAGVVLALPALVAAALVLRVGLRSP